MIERYDKRLLLILALAAFFLLFRITTVDMIGDDAIYSTRSIGLVDHMFGDDESQSTPLQWFSRFPWWANLSWHDHPLLLFLIQHAFLRWHPSLWLAKLPFGLMSLGTIVLTYAWVKRCFDRPTALLAALLLALNSHFIWQGRTTFLEAGVLFFISLAWYYFLRFLDNPAREWWKLGLAVGLMLETKFTALFIIPAFFVYLALRRRELFRRRQLYYAAGLALLLLAPVIIYNLMMYQATGHFSLQLVRLLGQSSPWKLGGIAPEWWEGILVNGRAAIYGLSFPYALLVLLAASFTLARRRPGLLLTGLAVVWLVIEDTLIGARNLYGIFLAPVVAVFLIDLGRQYCQKKWRRSWWLGGVAILSVYLMVFVANSNLLPKGFGAPGWWRESEQPINFGVAQLDRYLDQIAVMDRSLTYFDPQQSLKIKKNSLRRYLLVASAAERQERAAHSRVILFDGNINWFSRVWLFERRRFYNNFPAFSLNEAELLSQLNLEAFYFIKATEYAPLDLPKFRTPAADQTEQRLVAAGFQPALISRSDGQVAFKVYRVTADSSGAVAW